MNMTLSVFKEAAEQLDHLSVFRDILEEEITRNVLFVLQSIPEDETKAAKYLALLSHALQKAGFCTYAEFVTDYLTFCSCPWSEAVAKGNRSFCLFYADAAAFDIDILRHTVSVLAKSAEAYPNIPRHLLLCVTEGTIPAAEQLEDAYRKNGTGLFARARAFVWGKGVLVPVTSPDIPEKGELFGYRIQRKAVEENTYALLAGKRVNNVLLFGESGTGKSATVKSLLALPRSDDLRLIEIEKDSVRFLPELIRSLDGRRQKFILFIDDLSFDKDDDTYGVLKTILEGGIEPRPDNVAIYATSNRRNLVRQTFSDRSGDELDREETIWEKTALADRFGLRIAFLGLSKADYLALVQKLVRDAGITLPPEDLTRQAMVWDVRHPGRTPRSARQFVDSLGVSPSEDDRGE